MEKYAVGAVFLASTVGHKSYKNRIQTWGKRKLEAYLPVTVERLIMYEIYICSVY